MREVSAVLRGMRLAKSGARNLI